MGLHFNLTLGRPLSAPDTVRSLVDADGRFHSRTALARALLLRRIDGSELARELHAQLTHLLHAGLRPTHIDTHQHVHAFPLCFDAVADVCQQEGIPLRMPCVLRTQGVSTPPTRRLKQWLLARLLVRSATRWRDAVQWNTGLGSLFDLGTVPEQLHADHYRALLRSAPPGVFELMVHPATSAGELDGLTRIGAISEREWRLLRATDMRALAAEHGFTLGDYRCLATRAEAGDTP